MDVSKCTGATMFREIELLHLIVTAVRTSNYAWNVLMAHTAVW
jgi:hypothetical protein